MKTLYIFYCQNRSDSFLAIWDGVTLTSYDKWGVGRLGVEVLAQSDMITDFSPYHEYLAANYMQLPHTNVTEFIFNNAIIYQSLTQEVQ